MKLTRTEIEALLRGEKTKRLATEGFTTQDLASMLGVKTGSAQRHINEGVRDGTIEFAGRKDFMRIDGAKSTKPAYRLTKAKK